MDSTAKSEAADYLPEPETQIYNPVTGHYVKRNSVTGKLVEVKADGRAFKGVVQEGNITNVGIKIPKVVANKAEQAVITTLNSLAKPIQAIESQQENANGVSLGKLLERINPEYRELIDLSYFKGLTQAEISQMKNVPLHTINTDLQAALTQLRTLTLSF